MGSSDVYQDCVATQRVMKGQFVQYIGHRDGYAAVRPGVEAGIMFGVAVHSAKPGQHVVVQTRGFSYPSNDPNPHITRAFAAAEAPRVGDRIQIDAGGLGENVHAWLMVAAEGVVFERDDEGEAGMVRLDSGEEYGFCWEDATIIQKGEGWNDG